MEIKLCSCCKNEFPATEEYFYKVRKNESKLQNKCKSCEIAYSLKRKKDRVVVDHNGSKNCSTCGKCLPKGEFSKNYKATGGLGSSCKQCRRDYWFANKIHFAEKAKDWRNQNSDHIRQYMKQYVRERRSNDYNFRLLGILRSRVGAALKSQGACKTSKTAKLIGCNIPCLRLHLESKFYDRTDGTKMSMENYGLYGWHIDHITPCSSFDLSDPEQQKQCFHFTNLQPLWAEDNLAKSNKLVA